MKLGIGDQSFSYMRRGASFSRRANNLHRREMYATLFFPRMALYIREAAFVGLATQNILSPLAMSVATNPGRMSVTIMESPDFCDLSRRASR